MSVLYNFRYLRLYTFVILNQIFTDYRNSQSG